MPTQKSKMFVRNINVSKIFSFTLSNKNKLWRSNDQQSVLHFVENFLRNQRIGRN